jgi:hypothetical protein
MSISSEIVSFDSSFEQTIAFGNTLLDKVTTYKWRPLGDTGSFKWIPKGSLFVDRSYQRDVASSKILSIAAEWNWESCGAISVMERQDGRYVVVDGQNRTLAAWKRSDITHLPCMVFESQGIHHEATAFVEINTNRKTVSAYTKFKALLIAGDSTARQIADAAQENGFVIRPDTGSTKTITCIAACQRVWDQNPGKFREIFKVACELASLDDVSLHHILLLGLAVLNRKISVGLSDEKLHKRLKEIGARALVSEARKASYRAGKGGENIWAEGMLDIVNRKRNVKFTFGTQL